MEATLDKTLGILKSHGLACGEDSYNSDSILSSYSFNNVNLRDYFTEGAQFAMKTCFERKSDIRVKLEKRVLTERWCQQEKWRKFSINCKYKEIVKIEVVDDVVYLPEKFILSIDYIKSLLNFSDDVEELKCLDLSDLDIDQEILYHLLYINEHGKFDGHIYHTEEDKYTRLLDFHKEENLISKLEIILRCGDYLCINNFRDAFENYILSYAKCLANFRTTYRDIENIRHLFLEGVEDKLLFHIRGKFSNIKNNNLLSFIRDKFLYHENNFIYGGDIENKFAVEVLRKLNESYELNVNILYLNDEKKRFIRKTIEEIKFSHKINRDYNIIDCIEYYYTLQKKYRKCISYLKHYNRISDKVIRLRRIHHFYGRNYCELCVDLNEALQDDYVDIKSIVELYYDNFFNHSKCSCCSKIMSILL